MSLTNVEVYILVPTAATNEVLNPSFETGTTGYTLVSSTLARSSTYQRRGVWSLEVTPQTGVASGVYYGTVNEVNGEARTFSVDILGVAGQAMRIQIRDNTGASVLSETTFTASGYWQRISLARTGAASVTRRLYIIRDAVASTAKFYVDGLYYSSVDGTYLDGDMRGTVWGRNDYGWNGVPHASTSWRSIQTRTGGTLLRIKNYARILNLIGAGMLTMTNTAAMLSSGFASFQESQPETRELVLPLAFSGTIDQMIAARAALISALNPDQTAYQQALTLRFQGIDSAGADAAEPVDLRCHYVDGLENIPDVPGVSRASPRFHAFIPYFAKAADLATTLGFNTTVANFARIGMRDEYGIWKALGTGLNGTLRVLTIGPDGLLYAGGEFTLAGGVANTAYIARWNGAAWEALGTGMNDTVFAIAFGPDGTLYAGGGFTTAGGGAANRIAKWNGSAWSALSTGMDNAVLALAVYRDGSLYAAGDFTSAAGVANTAHIARWSGSTWNAVGTGTDSSIYALVFGPDWTLYAGGSFALAGGVADTAYIASWNGAVWAPLRTGMEATVLALAFGPDGMLYAGGDFTDASGMPGTYYIAKWNGSSWLPLGGGTNGAVYTLEFDAGGVLYAGGDFIQAGGIGMPDGVAQWNNGTWLPLDINVQDAAAYFYALRIDSAGRLYAGGAWTGSNALSATSSTTSTSGARAYPVFTFTGPGTLYQVKSYSTGKSIYFNGLTLLAGETATLDLGPETYHFGSAFRPYLDGYILNGSDLDFYLINGTNYISAYMLSTSGASAITARWQDLYWTWDAAKR